MKTILCFCLMAIILSIDTVSAQVLLAPAENAVGYVQRCWSPDGRWWTDLGTCLAVGQYAWYNRRCFADGLLEFNIDETTQSAPFPLPEMTAYNWVALLTGLEVEHINGGQGHSFPVYLLDHDDDQEDGLLTIHDLIPSPPPSQIIGSLCEVLLPVGSHLDPVDVTDALRNDLFGSGLEGDTSGFYFKTGFIQSVTLGVWMHFYRDMPRLEIFVNTTPTQFPTQTPVPGTSTPTPSGVPPTYTPTRTPTWTPHPDTPTNTPTPSQTPTPVPLRRLCRRIPRP